MTIIIVDDNKLCLNQLECYVKIRFLRSEVVRFADPRQAADYSATHSVDSIFTEIEMKSLDALPLANSSGPSTLRRQ